MQHSVALCVDCLSCFLLLLNFTQGLHAIACHVTPYKAGQNAHKCLGLAASNKWYDCVVGKQWGR